MRGLARFCYSKRRFVFIGWIVLLVGLFGISTAVSGEFRTDFELPGSESQEALDLLEGRGASDRTGISGQIVFLADQGIDDAAVRQRMEQFFSDIEASVAEVSVNSPYDRANAFQIAPGR